MPSIYDLKPRFQALLRPLVKSLAEAAVTANHVTIAAMIVSFIVGAAIVLFSQKSGRCF
jgi:CDP-diacylglycerol---glycerol-3-phosphate 3-phosphatidyltransferase